MTDLPLAEIEMSCYAAPVPAPQQSWLITLGTQLRTFRAARWVSQEDFIEESRRSGFRLTKHAVRTIERCRHANTRAYEQIASALGLTISANVVAPGKSQAVDPMSSWSPLMHYIHVIPPEDHMEVIALIEDWRAARRRMGGNENTGSGSPLA